MEISNRPRKSSKGIMKSSNNKIYMDLKEILRENALYFLPAKTLYRSLTVCREWKLMISTPFFVHNQSNCFRSISGIFFQSSGKPPSFLSLDKMAYGVPDCELKFLPEPVDVKASCNGLLCCKGRTGDRAYYVCNPVNKQWKRLPKPTTQHGSEPALVLVFEPSRLNFVAEYKVVCIVPCADIDHAYEFDIYSSAQDSWKVSGEMYFAKGSLQLKTGVYVNGVAYWPMKNNKLICFDLKKHHATEVYGYGGYGYGSSCTTQRDLALGEVNGKLCMSSMNSLIIRVYVRQTTYSNTMPVYNKSNPVAMNPRARDWEIKHDVRLNSAFVNLEASDQLRLLLIWDNVIMFQVGSRFFSHDVKIQKTTVLGTLEGFDSSCATFPYVNSLVSLI